MILNRCFVPQLLQRSWLLALLLLPVACARSAADVEQYLLPEPQAAAVPRSDAASLQLAPLQLAAYLDVPGLVLQTSDVELHAARNYRWAEALGLQLQRQLRQGLQQQLGLLVLDPPGTAKAEALQLALQVDAFHGEGRGTARVAGRWLLQQQGRIIASADFDRRVTLAADGYPALVRALGQAWHAEIAAIAAAISPLVLTD
jgi:uncharacterized lipoprotein YmbA